MMHDNPIGIFDSGIGGLNIWQELQTLLPNEHYIYVADNMYAPYGNKSKKIICHRSSLITNWLLQKKCKCIVVACNTATTNAIKDLRKHYHIPFIGIEPAIKPAAFHTKTGCIGVLATAGTLASSLFNQTADLHARHLKIIEQEGKGLVELIEKGDITSKKLIDLLSFYLDPMLEAGIDHLVLGCTHYPYLIPTLKTLIPKEVTIVDCGRAVAKQTLNILEKKTIKSRTSTTGHTLFYATGEYHDLQRFIPENNTAERVLI